MVCDAPLPNTTGSVVWRRQVCIASVIPLPENTLLIVEAMHSRFNIYLGIPLWIWQSITALSLMPISQRTMTGFLLLHKCRGTIPKEYLWKENLWEHLDTSIEHLKARWRDCEHLSIIFIHLWRTALKVSRSGFHFRDNHSDCNWTIVADRLSMRRNC